MTYDVHICRIKSKIEIPGINYTLFSSDVHLWSTWLSTQKGLSHQLNE